MTVIWALITFFFRWVGWWGEGESGYWEQLPARLASLRSLICVLLTTHRSGHWAPGAHSEMAGEAQVVEGLLPTPTS